MSHIKYSVLIPLKDEEGNIRELIAELEPVMQSLEEPWELICIDDGSNDQTPAILKELADSKRYLRVITFKRNYGQSSAFAAGFKLASGEFIITLDGDRQNDPADIPKLLDEMHDCDMACGSRQRRRDSWWRRIVSRTANTIRRRVCRDGMKDNNCSLKVYRSTCIKEVKMYEGMHRFLPALFIIEGFRIKEIPVNHRERERGKSKYNMLNRGVNTIFDLFAVFWMRRRHLNFEIES